MRNLAYPTDRVQWKVRDLAYYYIDRGAVESARFSAPRRAPVHRKRTMVLHPLGLKQMQCQIQGSQRMGTLAMIVEGE